METIQRMLDIANYAMSFQIAITLIIFFSVAIIATVKTYLSAKECLNKISKKS